MKKKLLSLALALILCMGLTVPALAATATEAIPCQYDYVWPFSEGLARVSLNKKQGYIDKTGKLVIPCQYEGASDFSEGVASVYPSDIDSCIYIDKTGKEIFPFTHDDGGSFSEGMSIIMMGEDAFSARYGYMNSAGKEVVPCQYLNVSNFSGGLAAVQNQESMWGYIDKTGKVVIPFQYKDMRDFSDGLARVQDENYKYGYIDKTGKLVIPCQYDNAADFSEGMAVVMDEIGPMTYQYGCIDTTGKEVVPCQYKGMRDFSDGLARVQGDNNKYGYIDKSGKLVIPCQYEGAGNFAEGLAAVQNESGLRGYIDKTGKLVIPYQYSVDVFVTDDIYTFHEGMAVVHNNDKYGFISISDDSASVTPGAFTDVKTSDYFADAVQWAVEKNITSGTSKTTFSPNATCSKAQILTFLWRANGSPVPTAATHFTDVKTADYFYKAALWAAEKGLVSGSTFGANTPCTRASTMEYMWKAAGSPAPAGKADFDDVPANADYAQAVAWAVENEITSGTGGGNFSPAATCTRGQIVTFLHRAMGK